MAFYVLMCRVLTHPAQTGKLPTCCGLGQAVLRLKSPRLSHNKWENRGDFSLNPASPQTPVYCLLRPRIHQMRFPVVSPQTGKLPPCCRLATDLSFMLRTYYGLVSDTMGKSPTSYGLATAKTLQLIQASNVQKVFMSQAHSRYYLTGSSQTS